MRWEVLRQQAPLATATQDVEDSIHHLAHIGRARPAASFCCRNEWCQHSPLGIGQISRITCQDHRPRLYPKRQMHYPTTNFQTGSQSLLGFEPHDGRWITGVLVGVDDPRRRMVLSAQSL